MHAASLQDWYEGEQELEVESTHLSHPSQDQMSEAARKESEADILANTAANAIELVEEAIAAANDARHAAEEAAQQQLAGGEGSGLEGRAEEVQQWAAAALLVMTSMNQN